MFLDEGISAIRKPPVDLVWDGRRAVWCFKVRDGTGAPYSLLALAVLAADLLSDAELPDVSGVLWLEVFTLSEPSLPAPVAGVAEELPRWSVL